MKFPVAFWLVIAGVMSCGSEKMNNGTGGATAVDIGGAVGTLPTSTGGTTTGTGGAAGGTEPGGVGGEVGGKGGGPGGAGGYPTCPAGVPVEVAGTILAADGQPVAAPVTATVTVTSVDGCTTSSCGCELCTATKANLRFVLADTGAARTWTLLLRIPDMPAEFIKAGDVLDMTVAASADIAHFTTINQTIVLARAGKVVAFTAHLASFFDQPLPQLDSFGIGVSDAGILCQRSNVADNCIVRPRAARVMIGTDIGTVADGQTRQVGGFSFSIGRFVQFVDTGFCDSKSETVMAGFRLP